MSSFVRYPLNFNHFNLASTRLHRMGRLVALLGMVLLMTPYSGYVPAMNPSFPTSAPFDSSISHFLNGSCHFVDKDKFKFVCDDPVLISIPPLPPFIKEFQLRGTGVTYVDGKPFNNTNNIHRLLLHNNNIFKIQKEAFTFLPNVSHLDLSGNRLTWHESPSECFFQTFVEMHRLETLILDNNHLTLTGVDVRVKDESAVLDSLHNISLRNNPITTVEKSFFYPVSRNLVDLNMNNCSLVKINALAFQHLSKLQHIYLQNNPALFQLGLHHPPISTALYYAGAHGNLTTLDISNNGLLTVPWITYFMLSRTLQNLDLSHNNFFQLGTIGSYFDYEIFPGMDALQYLNLKNSNIAFISNTTFSNLGSLEHLDLSLNYLPEVPNAVRLHQLKHLNISYQRPLNLLYPFNIVEMKIEKYSFFGMDSLETLDVSNYFLKHIEDGSFSKLSPLTSFSCSKCWMLQPISLEIWKTLPHLRYLDLSYSPTSLKSDESKKQITIFGNEDIMKNIRVLNLTCALLGTASLCRQENYTYESPLDPDLLIPMKKLEILHLGKNGLTSWKDRRFANNPNLKQLTIEFNQFAAITEAMLEDFKNLEYLDFRSTKLVACDKNVVKFYFWALERSESLLIEGWNAGEGYICDSVSQNRHQTYKKFSEHHRAIIDDLEEPIHDMLLEGLALGSILTAGVLIFLAVSVFKNRYYISYWILSRRRIKASKTDDDFQYDVFISYSPSEKDWVEGQLIPVLEERKPNLRTCIRERDFKVGVTMIDNIIECVDNSRKFVIILSEGFLSNQWCLFETHLAQHRFIENSRDPVIIVKKENIRDIFLNKNFKYLINTTINIQWTDQRQKQELFWTKLLSSLLRSSSDLDLVL